jgi:formylglycine-generating enzyme required for sulfatase activity
MSGDLRVAAFVVIAFLPAACGGSTAADDVLADETTGDEAGEPRLTDVGPPLEEAADLGPDSCVPDWECGLWSSCTCAGTQARTCLDLNTCGTTDGEPPASQSCDHCNGLACGDGGCGGDACGTCVAGNACASGLCQGDGCPAGYVLVPAGTFAMGSPPDDPSALPNETPREVTITNAYCLKATEVTQAEWQALMADNPSGFGSCGSACPVESVSWWDAVAYCNALSAKEGLAPCYALAGCTGTPGSPSSPYACTGATFAGLSCAGYRLPTEAEWENAARAGTTTDTYGGNSPTLDCTEPNPVLDPIAWFQGNSCVTPPSSDCQTTAGSGCGTQAVKGRRANAWGLFDVLGNVSEWCGDGYGPYPAGAVKDPVVAASGQVGVYRGGSWRLGAGGVRAAVRFDDTFASRVSDVGLRPARSLPGTGPVPEGAEGIADAAEPAADAAVGSDAAEVVDAPAPGEVDAE